MLLFVDVGHLEVAAAEAATVAMLFLRMGLMYSIVTAFAAASATEAAEAVTVGILCL